MLQMELMLLVSRCENREMTPDYLSESDAIVRVLKSRRRTREMQREKGSRHPPLLMALKMEEGTRRQGK